MCELAVSLTRSSAGSAGRIDRKRTRESMSNVGQKKKLEDMF